MEQNKKIREVFYYKNYYLDFFETLNPETKKKFNWTIQLIETMEKVPEKHFKYLSSTRGLFEIRVEAMSNIYRVFCFFDKGQLIILLNGFQKKSQKTPTQEIQFAERLMKEYFDEQKNNQ